ncbi:hypothetical protein [Amnibacterium endophyticum]|uniref:Uncharacterized protein n=1 Tax=Amnibacterium endophyticum TaxID=2109337 RepID=A0ABW4LGK3_9MICO
MSAAARVLVALATLPRAIGRARVTPEPDTEGAAPELRPAPPPGRGLQTARGVLIGLGVLLLAVAGGALVSGVPTGQWPAIGVWLAVALVLHDGLLAPLLVVGARLLRRGSARLPWGALAAVQAAVAVGFCVTLLAIPAIRAQQLGARNPTVLVFDYAAHLAAAWAVVGVVVAAAIVLGAIRRSRAD